MKSRQPRRAERCGVSAHRCGRATRLHVAGLTIGGTADRAGSMIVPLL
jgi:hypothetical protein